MFYNQGPKVMTHPENHLNTSRRREQPFFNHLPMPPPLTDQAQNGPKTKRREYTIAQKAEWFGRFKSGASTHLIAQEFGIPQKTVSFNIRKALKNNDFTNSPRSGRPRKTTDRDDRTLIREAIKKGGKGRRQPLAEINQNVMPHVSRTTVKRRLQEANIKKWRATHKILLLPEHMDDRLA
jgi:hypothetical protein